MFEAIDYRDPLTVLLEAEGEDTDDLESQWDAGTHRAQCYEGDRYHAGDMCGAAPYEHTSAAYGF